MSSSRKRVITSCLPCYTRKQKCNRRTPCANCTRRQCSQECVYQTTQANQPANTAPHSAQAGQLDLQSHHEVSDDLLDVTPFESSLANVFGYREGCNGNMVTLLKRMGLEDTDSYADEQPIDLPSEAAETIQQIIRKLPDRKILDFLTNLFVSEVNWIDQLVHVPWFLAEYQQWWSTTKATHVTEVDFTVLILRICSYASQFIPCPAYPLDKIRGIALADIRKLCDETANRLAAISNALDTRGSLLRVQHLAFLGLSCQMEEKRDEFWESLSRAVQVAERIGICSESRASQSATEPNKVMERMTACNLYVWDSLLSRQLESEGFVHARLRPGKWPCVKQGSESEFEGIKDLQAPDSFCERILEARLADFWRQLGPVESVNYDMLDAEERYDKFCSDYLATLPPAFALEPDLRWDSSVAKLPMQRQLLHIAIYDSMCWNFRPLLVRYPHDTPLPAFKSVLLGLQKKSLAVAALHTLDSIKQLHSSLGGRHTRFSGLVYTSFEAAVLLIYLCSDPHFPMSNHNDSSIEAHTSAKTDLLRAEMNSITWNQCVRAVQEALSRLQTLSDVSSMAECGASTLARLLANMNLTPETNSTLEETQSLPRQEATSGTQSPDESLSRGDLRKSTIQDDLTRWSNFDSSTWSPDPNIDFGFSPTQGLHEDWDMSMMNAI